MLRNFFRRLVEQFRPDQDINQLYKRYNYLSAYSRHTDIRVERDPHAAVGGMWDELGKLQYYFLISNGLQPHHRLLDIGCGTLRGGRHFINYLNVGNYSGLDISPNAIDFGKQLVQEEGLSEKHPRLVLSRNKDLCFNEFTGETFEYLFAQSVFTHLKPEHIEECIQHIGRIMNKDSVFFFTFNDAPEFRQTGIKDFCYPYAYFSSLAVKYKFTIRDRSNDYQHIRGQHIASLSKI